MAMFQLFGKTADKKSPASGAETEAAAVAVLEPPPAPAKPAPAKIDPAPVAEDPKLASLLQRIQQLTTAPEAGSPSPAEHQGLEIGGAEPQASVNVPVAGAGPRDDYVPREPT